MQLEATAVESYASSTDYSSILVEASLKGREKAEELSQEFAGEIDAESIEVSLMRARTTLILDSPAESDELNELAIAKKTKYVQGVTLGQHAYLITNLLRDESQTLLQPQKVWTIGRNREAAFPMQDPMLSRRHAVIMHIRNEGFYLVDLNSMNGSFVNGIKVKHRHLLEDGDRVCLGNVTFNFFVSGQVKSLNPIHPEVLSRLSTPESRPIDFIDYIAPDESLFG